MFRKKTHQHTNHQHHHSHNKSGHHQHVHKKKLSLFYKISFAVAVFISLILLYFIILVSAQPKSFPYITKKIEEYLEKNFVDDASIANSTITFTPYGSFKIGADNVELRKDLSDGQLQQLNLPRIEGEFSLLDILLFRFTPSRIKIANPEIIINGVKESQTNEKSEEFLPLVNLFETIKNKDLHIKYFEVENAKFIIKKENQTALEIFLKLSQNRIKSKKSGNEEVLFITSNNIIRVNNGQDIAINAGCNFRNIKSTNCNLSVANLDIKTVAILNPNLKIIEKIRATLGGTVALFLADGKMTNLSFKVDAKEGEAELPEFFSEKLFLQNIAIKGDYNRELDSLNLSEIKADLDNKFDNSLENPHLSMSLLFHNLQNEANNKTDFYITLSNVLNSDLKKYWLISLPAQDIRKWVIEHIYGGMIKDAYAKFTLAKNDGETSLENLDAKINFSATNLKYDDYFPVINDMNGSAVFTKNSMKISLTSGNLLNSRIEQASVAIDDFNDITTILNIKGKISGNAADGLKHANYKSSFAYEIEKYLNGSAHSEIDIRIPLTETMALKDLYIAVKSNVSGMNSDYAIGNLAINTLKKFNSNNFAVTIDITNAALVAKAFNIEKNIGSPGNINLNLIIANNDEIQIKNLELYKKEKVKNNFEEGKISGDISFSTAPFLLKTLNIKNENFGENNYQLSYLAEMSNKTISQKIIMKGKLFNLASFLQNKLPSFDNSSQLGKTNVNITLDKILLVNKKSIRKFSLALTGNNGIFNLFSVYGNYGNRQSLNFATLKKSDSKFPIISGNISDIGYMAEGLGISDTVSSGNTKIKITQAFLDQNNVVYNADVSIDSDITFYENHAIKRLESNSLFSKVKDKIFSNNKTTFDYVKAELTLQNKNLTINSLIANNYKIGITSKGYVNLANNTYYLKGMIIPGFVINNLFGIGKIPLIGGVISGLLTGGEGGGLFGIKYEYKKLEDNKEPIFTTDTVSSFVPVTIRNLFEF